VTPKAATAPTTAPKKSQADAPKTNEKTAPAIGGKEDFQRRKESEKAIKKVEKAIAATEAKIAELESQMAENHEYTKYAELQSALNREMHEWEKLNYELDILKDE
jgi:ATP-binding cassette subfamily F protein 3